MAIELGEQGMSDQDERSPSGGFFKEETTVDYSGLRDAVERSKEDTGSEYPQSLLRDLSTLRLSASDLSSQPFHKLDLP